MLAWEASDGLLFNNKKRMIKFVCTGVFNVCVREIRQREHSVMNYIWFLCSCGINNHRYHQTGNSWWALDSPGFPLVKAPVRGRSSHKATLDSVGLGWWQKRTPGWRVVKYNMRAVIQLGLCERSKDRLWIYNRNTHSSSKGSMTGSSMGVSWDTHTHKVHTY